ncbi:MAG: NADPH-dependent oxidoreductase [Anaerolineales bacterium]|nr:NADPH-dependent oxidoreductase [Anaerolineales bacterium]
MMNATLELIHKHGSVRRYETWPVPASVIETIVTAGQRASTSSNFQAYSVIAVTEEEKRLALYELCGKQHQVAEAPVFLAWCADLSRTERASQLRGYTQNTDSLESFLLAATDTVIAAQNAALAAESLGLGICYIGAIRNNPQEVIELLNLPPLTFPITGMTIGWPTKKPNIRPRLPLKAVLHWEKFNSNQDEYLMGYDLTMLKTGIYKNRQISLDGKPDKIEDYSWTEHTARRLAKPLRPHLKKIIKQQGFGLE